MTQHSWPLVPSMTGTRSFASALRTRAASASISHSSRCQSHRRKTTTRLSLHKTTVADSGACVWFTGLSGSGKSTTAEALVPLLQQQHREVTVLDGDVVRTHLSKGLGFNRDDRDTNVRRVGYVAGEVVRHGGLVVAALVSPYRAARDEARSMVGAGRFVEVFVDTPLDVVEQRDVKGWYAKARAGEVKEFTGVDDPYEPPLSPELTLQTVDTTPQANAALVLQYLGERGFVDLA
jgi:sulfate adenylyltransferase